MRMILEYVCEKLNLAVHRIVELLTEVDSLVLKCSMQQGSNATLMLHATLRHESRLPTIALSIP